MSKHAEKKPGWRLNLFDGIVIALAAVVGGVLLWSQLWPANAPTALGSAATEIRYTIRLQRVVPGMGDFVSPGDLLEDNIKNYALGMVVSSESMPSTRAIFSEEDNAYHTKEVPGYDDVDIVIASTATIDDEEILLDGGYTLRVGDAIYVRGPGYLGSGVVRAIER